MPNTHRHTWALAVATYERREDLCTCVELALSQSRPPAEVVVVDASRDFDGNKAAIEAVVGQQVPLIYVKARRPSAAVQRNQCADLASADVVFLIDDDSLLFPEAAARVMQVYDADVEGRVAGVATKLAPTPPPVDGQPVAEQQDEPVGPHGGIAFTAYGHNHGKLGQWLRKVLKSDQLFVPYDDEFPSHELTSALLALPVGPRTLMAGMSMTARRQLVVEERFDEELPDRGPEDSDLSYRLSRRGALLTRFDAHIHHVGSPTGRLASSVRSAVDAVAPLMLHGKYSTDRNRSLRRSKSMLRRRMLMGVLKDLRFGRLSLPTAKGFWIGLRAVQPLLGRPREEADRWFAAWKQRIL